MQEHTSPNDGTQYLSLGQAAKLVPTTSGKPPSAATLFRWATKGVRGVKLAHVRFGRRIAVTREALEEFAAAVAEAYQALPPERPERPDKLKTRSAARRERDIAAAEARLRDQGVIE